MLISTIFLVVTTTGHIVQGQKTSANFLTYENSTYGIKIQYPSSWSEEQNGTKQDTATDIIAFSPPTSNSNVSLDVTMDDISDEKGISLTQYATNGLSDLKQSLKNFKSVAFTTAGNVLSGLPAYKSVYTFADGNTISKDLEIGTIKGDKAYYLIYDAGINEYDKYLPIIQQMINSFQITK